MLRDSLERTLTMIIPDEAMPFIKQIQEELAKKCIGNTASAEMIFMAMQAPCLFCSGVPITMGLFVPDDPKEYGGHSFALYTVCRNDMNADTHNRAVKIIRDVTNGASGPELKIWNNAPDPVTAFFGDVAKPDPKNVH